MTKTVIFKVLRDFHIFSFEVSIQNQDEQEPTQFQFISNLSDTVNRLENWRRSWGQYIPIRRGERIKASREVNKKLNLTSNSAYDECNHAKKTLIESLNNSLDNSKFKNWFLSNLGQDSEPMHIIIQTDSLEVATLPWEQWSFWDNYYDNNDLVIALSFLKPLHSKTLQSKILNSNSSQNLEQVEMRSTQNETFVVSSSTCILGPI